MPTYEYACRDCGEHVEVVQSFSAQPLTTCSRCRGPLRKVFSAAGIIFKGSGYYVTDSRKSEKKPAKEDAAASSSTGSSSESSSGSSSESSSGSSDSSSEAKSA